MYLVCLRYVNIILAATVDSQSKQFWNFCRKIEGGGGKSGFPKIEGGGAATCIASGQAIQLVFGVIQL